MARKAPAQSAKRAAPPKGAAPSRSAAPPQGAAPSRNGAPANGAARSRAVAKPAPAKSPAAGPRQDLLARAALNAEGAHCPRSDALADAKAARSVAQFVAAHQREFARRGLPAGYSDAALALAAEIEDHLQSLPAAGISVRERSEDKTELLVEAAATAHAVREAVLRVTRGPGGRAVAHAFGLGSAFSPRQPAFVLEGLQRIVAAARKHPAVAADIGLGADELVAMGELAKDLAQAFPGAKSAAEHRLLLEAQGGLRAFFDLVAAKALLAFAGDPDERARLLSLLPRADDRRHSRRVSEAPAA